LRNIPGQNQFIRVIYEALFSVNIALPVILEKSNTSPFWLLVRLKYSINSYLHLHPHRDFGGYVAFFALAAALAIIILLVLRLFSKTLAVWVILKWTGGILALAVAPASWFRILHLGRSPLDFGPTWPASEVGVAIVCVLLYMLGKWPLRGWTNVLLLIVHCGVWCLVFVQSFRTPVATIFPIVSFCCCLAWSRCFYHDGTIVQRH